MTDNLTPTQKILAFLVIAAFIIFIIVAYRANQNVQTTASNAQVATSTSLPSCTTDADCIAYATSKGACTSGGICPLKCDTKIGQCTRSLSASASGSGSTTSTTSTSGGGSTSTGSTTGGTSNTGGTTGSSTGSTGTTSTGSGSNSGTPSSTCQEGVKALVTKACTTSSGAKGIEVSSIICWNEESLPVSSGCIDATVTSTASGTSASRLGDIRTQAMAFCAGKKAPSCSGAIPTVAVPPIGTTGVPIPASCDAKAKGDANCDGKIDLLDFTMWLSEFTEISKTINADMNGDGKVSGADFEIWRGSFTSGT